MRSGMRNNMEETTRESQTHYALAALAAKRQAIVKLAAAMTSGRAKVESHMAADRTLAHEHYAALKEAHARLADEINECRPHLAETGSDGLAAHAASLAASLAGFNLMTPDYGPLTAAMRGFADSLPAKDTADASVIARCMNAVRMGHYPTDLGNIGHIMRGIAFPDGTVTNLLDPCCGEGAALKKLAVGNNCMTYGVEIDEGRAEGAQRELHRVGIGSFFHSRISRDAFHAILLNPPYMSVTTEGGGKTRAEKRFLIESIPHLMPGGLMIYIVPHYRLTPDICRILCDNLTDITVHRFTDDEFKKWGQVAVMGRRIKRTDGSETARALADLACRKDAIPVIAEIAENRHALPAAAKKVDIFKGAVFNLRELARQLRQSGSFDGILAKKPPAREMRRPPLPFTISQLGLIGGSGLINGLVECDSPHVIKGRIVKETLTESTENHDGDGRLTSTEITEKTVNRMTFSILTPDGFKSLA